MHLVCLLFSGCRGLDDQNVRNSILRIPEVSRKLKEAQRLIDSNSENHTDLFSYVVSSDQEFNSKPALRALVSDVVQVGLFDRYVRYRNRPSFMVGRTNGSSALKVCAGTQTFEEFIVQSEYCNSLNGVAQLNTTKLAGIAIEEYGVFQWNNEGDFENFDATSKEAAKIVEELSVDNKINQCIHIGPCADFRMQELADGGVDLISSMNSIDLDPILSSFWKSA